MSITFISINEIPKQSSSNRAAAIGNDTCGENDDDDHLVHNNEEPIMTLHRECKDDEMYESSVSTTTTFVKNQSLIPQQHPSPPPPLRTVRDETPPVSVDGVTTTATSTTTTTTTTTTNALSSSSSVLISPLPQQQQQHSVPFLIVSNKCETIFVSSNGDVLTSRCRSTPYPTSSSSLALMGNDGSHSGPNLHSNRNHNTNNNNGIRSTVNTFPWSAVVCCDHLVYPHSHNPNDSHSGDDPHHDDNDLDHHPNGNDNSHNNRHHDDRQQMVSHGNSAFAPHHHSEYHTTTATYNKNNNSGTDSNVDEDALNGGTSPSSSSTTGSNHNRHISLIKSFDHSQYSEMNGMDDTQWSSPISRNNERGTLPNDNAITPTTSTAHTTTWHPGNKYTGSNYNHHTTTTSAPRQRQQQQTQQQLFHGIPTFVSYFSSIKIRHVSANPMGAHVLLISHPGILYAYGLNTYGQLGIGWKSHIRDSHQGYVMRPTIVTSLLENGGKTIACAAGVSHSLVVVEVEERRIMKSRSLEIITERHARSGSSSSAVLRTRQHQNDDGASATTASTHESEVVKYHQMYGFGRNDYMKIGLISPKVAVSSSSKGNNSTTAPAIAATMSGNVAISLTNHNTDQIENVLFPRRVALRCSVIHKKVQSQGLRDVSPTLLDSSSTVALLPPKGIFAIAASSEHSAALVHQPNGDIELYTWGNATYGTLGLPPSSFVTPPLSTTSGAITTTTATFRIAPYPSLVECLSKTSNFNAQSQKLLRHDINEFPTSISLSRCCSFVATNLGRCFSFGTSEDGMLGLGRTISETQTPMEITLPGDVQHEKIISVSAGSLHVTVCTDVGHVYSWGSRSHAGFDVQTSSTMSQQQNRKPPSIMKGPTPIEDWIQFEWSPRRVEFSSSTIHGRSKNYQYSDVTQKLPSIIHARAGNDCTFFVTDCGKVLSSGKGSGRLGQGENDTDITTPKPLFAGLHLFQQKENHDSLSANITNDESVHLRSTATTTSLRSRARRLASV